MDESFQLANATTAESLLEIGSVLDASLNDWNEEFSAGSSKTRAEKAWRLAVSRRKAHPWD